MGQLINMWNIYVKSVREKLTRERVMARVEEEAKPVLWKKDEWVADYKRIRVMGIKA
ncbi:hypothetical protein [Neobacillus jeddahensis]|uniref:hypothetical protein n=1 Tax=Neobacillus jeddahensis TaxID=1461580 RepID=UPI000A442D23|nr:hypothetical protein [Neobacillus jeddahensis]